MSRSVVVLDASVVLAAVLREPGGKRALGHEVTPLLSAVNYAETLTRLVDRGYDKAAVDVALGFVPFEVVDFNREQAENAANLREPTRTHGLSLGDRACLSLAISRGAKALTADRAWQRVDVPVQIEMVR